MDPAYFSAFAALAGSVIGGLTSLGASWLTQHTQLRAQEVARNSARREELYRDFIEEASKLYADALEHDTADTSKLVALYALVSRMRVLSSPPVVERADRAMRAIVDTYLGPNKTFRELVEMTDLQEIDILRDFGDACREELRRFTA
jgi:hypothetical protein